VPARRSHLGQEGPERDPFRERELATFFQEEKKFNTTWRVTRLAWCGCWLCLDKPDLDQVRHHRASGREQGWRRLARQYSEILKNVRGAGVMLAST